MVRVGIGSSLTVTLVAVLQDVMEVRGEAEAVSEGEGGG